MLSWLIDWPLTPPTQWTSLISLLLAIFAALVHYRASHSSAPTFRLHRTDAGLFGSPCGELISQNLAVSTTQPQYAQYQATPYAAACVSTPPIGTKFQAWCCWYGMVCPRGNYGMVCPRGN